MSALTKCYKTACKAPVWQPVDVAITRAPDNLRSWLIDKNSLTEKLANTFAKEVKVKILHQEWGLPDTSEIKALNSPSQRYMIRRVQLVLNGIPYIYARSVFPEKGLYGDTYNIYDLGERPLGELLFKHNRISIRGMFEITSVFSHQVEPDSGMLFGKQYWGRRSVFLYRQKHPILVTEYFLADMPDSTQVNQNETLSPKFTASQNKN